VRKQWENINRHCTDSKKVECKVRSQKYYKIASVFIRKQTFWLFLSLPLGKYPCNNHVPSKYLLSYMVHISEDHTTHRCDLMKCTVFQKRVHTQKRYYNPCGQAAVQLVYYRTFTINKPNPVFNTHSSLCFNCIL
jgi:hypothetical protein